MEVFDIEYKPKWRQGKVIVFDDIKSKDLGHLKPIRSLTKREREIQKKKKIKKSLQVGGGGEGVTKCQPSLPS